MAHKAQALARGRGMCDVSVASSFMTAGRSWQSQRQRRHSSPPWFSPDVAQLAMAGGRALLLLLVAVCTLRVASAEQHAVCLVQVMSHASFR